MIPIPTSYFETRKCRRSWLCLVGRLVRFRRR